MKKLMFSIFVLSALCSIADGAATNVVEYTDAKKVERERRVAEWRETWEKMTPEQRAAHSEAQEKRIAEQRAAKGEVKREVDADGNIVITYKDGSVVVHKCGKK